MASIFRGFFDNLFNGLTNPKGNLADFQHAARLYIDNNMRLAPKVKHLYHVVLNVNPSVKNHRVIPNNIQLEINLLCKNATLPGYRANTEVLNQYNRKKVVQTGIQYTPINIEFHDDNAGLTTLFWESYFRYYYSDSDYTSRSPGGDPSKTAEGYLRSVNGINNIYANSESFKWKYGLDKANKVDPFLSSIQIFQLHPQNTKSTYTCFTLINPIIEQFEHSDVNQEVSEFSTNRMVVNYESVQYSRGVTVIGSTPDGFAETHYDKIPSPLTIEGGGTTSIARQGGIIQGLDNTFSNFSSGNFLGGLITGSNTLSNLQNLSRAGLIEEASSLVAPVLTSALGNIKFASNTASNEITKAVPRDFGDLEI